MGDDPKETNSDSPDALLSSILAESPELWDIVQEFAKILPAQVEEMQSSLESGSLDRLGAIASNLKEAGNRYGYSELTEEAGALERAAQDGLVGELAKKVAALRLLSQQIKVGLRDS